MYKLFKKLVQNRFGFLSLVLILSVITLGAFSLVSYSNNSSHKSLPVVEITKDKSTKEPFKARQEDIDEEYNNH